MYLNIVDIVNRNYFEFLYIIGRGGFGKVWKVKLKKTNEYFALKEMFKVKVIDRRSEFSIMSERNLLSKLKHPFIVNMHFAFQDFSKLYLVMDLLSGGDLRYHIAKKKAFTEQETKFFISNLILSLEYIHSQKIIHRDIKPENLVLDSKGYVRLTDFGIAKINEKDNSSETSGTPGYMAPEVILIQNHSYAADFFALGVIGFEFMMGFRPYLGRSRKEIKDLIISKQAKIRKGDLPNGWGMIAADFINRLLQRNPNKRLGYQNISEIKEHPWMKDIDWDYLNKKELEAPFLPYSNKENFDKAYCEGEEKIGDETLERYDEYIQSEFFEGLFPNYTYIDIGEIINYQKIYGNTSEDKNNNNIYTKTNYNINYNNKDNIFKEVDSNKEYRSNLMIKSNHNNKNPSLLENIKAINTVINDIRSDRAKNIKKIAINDEELTEIEDNKDISNKQIKVVSQKESRKNILIKREASFDIQNEKHKFNNINIKSDKIISNNKSKEKKIKRGKGMINISTIQKFLLKNNNNNKINFNLTKNMFLYKSNSVKMMKNKQKDLMYYNNLINKKKEESNTSNSSKSKNMIDLKDINKNKKISNLIVQHYLNNKNINKSNLNILLNNYHNNIPNKRPRNKSQGEGDEFQRKIFSWLNNKESANENNKKGKTKKTKNNFLNSNNYLYLNNNKILNINTINKNKNFMPNNKLKNTNFKAINNFNNNEGKNLNSNNSNDINISINKKNIKDNETIINHYHHPKFNSINIKKNKLFNYLSNPNIHKKNIIQNNKFPFIYNINTISNYTKNLLTININDSYSKDLISTKAININNNNYLTSNNIRQSYKNIRNIIVNNISPTVNVLIHSEEKKISKKKKISNEKRANTINNKENFKTIKNNNYDEINNKRKKTKKIFNEIS